MRSPVRSLVILAILFGAAALAAHADTFTYALSDGFGTGIVTFSVKSPTLITTDTVFTAGERCSYQFFSDCRSLELNPILGYAQYDIYVHNQLGFVENIPIPPGDFLAPGTYRSAVPGEYFSIVDNPSTVTPEPSSLILLGTGVLGFAVAVRRTSLNA